MNQRWGDNEADLNGIIEEILTDAYGEDEQLWAFRQAFEDEVAFPANASVIGEPVSVIEIDYDGNERRGLTARCRREDGSEHTVALPEVLFPGSTTEGVYAAAYRKWLGLEPYPRRRAPRRTDRRKKIAEEDLDLGDPTDLVVLSVKQRAARCRLLGGDRGVTLRTTGLWDLAPGHIVTVAPRKQWRYGGRLYLSGEIESTRLDAAALGLEPLHLEELGPWDPAEQYWGEEADPVHDRLKPIIARGPRPAFEMEQVIPGEDPDDPFDDPIGRSVDLKDAGDRAGARELLMGLCDADLRCLDAHAHLGNLLFDRSPEFAIRHYEAGLRIGELSLGDPFDGVLLWAFVDNRPFLRCLHGYGLCLWRLGRFSETTSVFERLLWLNPRDNLGVRFVIGEVESETAWADRELD